jgi:hypothetical protein
MVDPYQNPSRFKLAMNNLHLCILINTSFSIVVHHLLGFETRHLALVQLPISKPVSMAHLRWWPDWNKLGMSISSLFTKGNKTSYIPVISRFYILYTLYYIYICHQFYIPQGLAYVLIKYRPTIGGIISNKYSNVMLKIPQNEHLPTPVVNNMRCGIHGIMRPVKKAWWFHQHVFGLSSTNLYKPGEVWPTTVGNNRNGNVGIPTSDKKEHKWWVWPPRQKMSWKQEPSACLMFPVFPPNVMWCFPPLMCVSL